MSSRARQSAVFRLVEAYRAHAHKVATFNPLAGREVRSVWVSRRSGQGISRSGQAGDVRRSDQVAGQEGLSLHWGYGEILKSQANDVEVCKRGLIG